MTNYQPNTNLADEADRIWFTNTGRKNHIWREWPPDDVASYLVRSDGKPFSYCGRALSTGYSQSPDPTTRDELQDCAVCIRAWHADDDV